MQRAITLLERALDAINVIVGVLMAAGIALIFVLLTGQVVLRYLVFAPFNWVEEGATYLMAILTLLGMSLLMRQNIHLQVDLLRDNAGRYGSVILRLFALLVTAALGYYLMRSGWAYAWAGRNELSPSGTFNVFWPRLAIPLGSGLLMIQALFMAIRVVLPARAARTE